MAAFPDEGAQRTGGERREIDRHQLRGDAAADERHQPGILRRSDRFGQQSQRKTREIFAALAVAQPVGDERAEIDLPQLGLDRSRFEEMHLDELAELVGDAVLVALDNCRVRDRQSQRLFEQRHHGVPVGEAADRGGLGKGCDEAEHRMQRQQRLRAEENCKRRRQYQRRQQFYAPQLGGARGVAGGIDDECGRKGHGGFRRVTRALIIARCPTAVIPGRAKHEPGIVAHGIPDRRFASSGMTVHTRQKEGPPKRAFKRAVVRRIAIRRSWSRPWRSCPARSWHPR